ncbi:Uncharacterised protein [Yersinia enterocolitica]|nr:Uncharacterised protein [Yersinia enterocolitica]
MTDSLTIFLSVSHCKGCSRIFQLACIANLAARLTVEWRLIEDNNRFFTFMNFINSFAIAEQCSHCGLLMNMVIARELACTINTD